MALIEIGSKNSGSQPTRMTYAVRLAWHTLADNKPKRLAVFLSGEALSRMGWSRGDSAKLLYDDEGPALIIQRCGKGAGRAIGKNGAAGGIIHVPNFPLDIAAHFIGDEPRSISIGGIEATPADDQLRIPARVAQPQLLELS